MELQMYDIVSRFGEVNIFLVLAIAIVGFVTLSWMVAKWRASKVEATAESDVLNVKDLSSELTTVTNWYRLGINLNLQSHELNKIQQSYVNPDNDRRMLQMLDLWLRRTPNATWEDVVSALEQMGENRVAENIRQKYHIERGPPSIQEDIQEESVTVGIAQISRQDIDAKFATLLMNTCRKLGGMEINKEDLRVFLTCYFSPGECIPKTSSIHEIFEAITCHKLWDYWNYYPLEGIVQGFAADDQEITSWIETYRQDLESYKVMTKLIDHIATAASVPTVGESPSDEERPARYDKQYYQRLSCKLKTRFTDHTLKYIDKLWNKFANLYSLPPRVVLLDCIHKGCVSIVWLVPSRLAPQILNATPPSDEFYHKLDIMRVEFNEKCLYQEEKKVYQETEIFAKPEPVVQVAHSTMDFPSTEVVYPGKSFQHEVSRSQRKPSLSSFRMEKMGTTRLSGTETCNSAYEIFRKNLPYLLMTIRDPEMLAEELFAKNVVSHAVVESASDQMQERGVRVSKLLMAVESRIEVNPGVFSAFLSVLAKRYSMSDLYRRMKDAYISVSLQTPSDESFRMEKMGDTRLSAESETISAGENFNPAYEAFHKHSADLFTVIQDPEVLAWELFSKDVVPPTIVEFTSNKMHDRGLRISKLLMVVESQIAVDPQAFDVVLSVLTKRPSMCDLLRRMKDTYGIQLSSIITYASYLKSVYTREKFPVYDKWPLVKSKKYINLALVEMATKRKLTISQIFQPPDGSQSKWILVEGAPGVGKSTFAWKLCRKWGKGELLQQYQLVVLLRLRDKSVRAAKNISDLFQYCDPQIQQAVVKMIQRTGGKGVFLLFEGYDELPEELRTKKSVFLNVITGKELPEATVLITSRPWASEFLNRQFYNRRRQFYHRQFYHREFLYGKIQHIEIQGFTKDNIQSYLESTISNEK